MYYFSNEINFGQLLQTFGDFYPVTLAPTHPLPSSPSSSFRSNGNKIERIHSKFCILLEERFFEFYADVRGSLWTQTAEKGH